MPESIQHRADVDALLAATTNYEDRLPRDPLRKALDLGRVEALLESIGNPQEGPRTVHVAGSKGKGSTARMIAAGLRAAGRGPVGLYTSPHLQDLSERICVDGAPVTEDALARAAQAVLPALRARLGTPEAPTFFELFTAMAWHVFREAGCSDVVLETGLGGRLDATNVCRPAVTVLTTIELEHTRLLGSTIAAIAKEKAGILKAGVPAVCTAEGDAAEVIQARATALGCALLLAGRDFEVRGAQAGPGPTLSFRLRTPEGTEERAALPFAGVHQAGNAAAAWLCLRLLGITGDAAWRGLSETRLPGAMEVVGTAPTVVIDGAHTGRSAQAARAGLSACWPGRAYVLVLAMLEEKDVQQVAAPLVEGARAVVVTQVDSPRAVPASTLAEALLLGVGIPLADGTEIEVEAVPARALERARALAGAEGLILCTGSIYLAGEIRTLLQDEPRA